MTRARWLRARRRAGEERMDPLWAPMLAQRLRTRRLLTFDERAFRAIAPLQGGTFSVLPADR